MSKASTSKRSVLDERFLKCGVCNERFWDNSKLIKHMESHAETKQLLCTICNKTFSAVQDLDKHYLLHRQLMQPYGCPACESRFVTQHQLMTHVENIHPELTIGGNSESNSKSPETTTSRRNSPRKNQIKIENVRSIPDKKPQQPKKEKAKSPITSEESFLESTQSTAKKSILKMVPTPSGKKKPLIWKDPIVSPEKKMPRNVVSVQYKQSSSEKRKLVSAPGDSSGAKKVKLVTSTPVGGNSTPRVKLATPLQKTPVAKTKLMQSISKLYDKQTPNEKKSLAQTRKDLLNALTITPVTKGPIRVLKNTKPFISYSPSKDPIRPSNSENEINRNVEHNSASSSSVAQGKLNECKQNVKTVCDTSQDFDKLLTSKTNPCSVKTSDKKMQQVSFDKSPQSSSSKASVVQLIQIKTSPQPFQPQLTIQPISPGNSKNTKIAVQNVIKCAVVSPARQTKLIQQIIPACKIPQGLKIIPQSPPLKPAQMSPANKSVSSADSTETIGVRLTKNPKSVVIEKPPTKEMVEPKPETQLISERDIHRDPVGKCKNLQILLPRITLKRFSSAELKESLGSHPDNNTIEANSVKKTSKLLPDKANIVKEQVNVKLREVRGVKRQVKQQSTEDCYADKPSKLKCSPEERAKNADAEEQSTVKPSNAKTLNKPAFTVGNSTQEQSKLKIGGIQKGIRGKLQLADIKEAQGPLPVASGIAQQPNLSSIKVSPKITTRNATHSKSELPNEEPANKTNNRVITRRRNSSGSPVLESDVADSAKVEDTIVPAATRRSKRILVKKTKEENEVSKKEKRARKEVLKNTPVKKYILKRVIEEEVNAIENVENKTDKVLENTSETVTAPPALNQTPNKIRVVTLTPEVMKKLKETVLKKTSSTTPNHIRLVVPSEVLCRIQNSATKSQNSESPSVPTTPVTRTDPLSSLKVSVVPSKTNIIRYGIEDLKRDQQRRKEEKEKMAEKEKILKKMLVKFDEKEKKKQMKFCEKKLTRFLEKHQESHVENLAEKLLNVRSISQEDGIELLEEVKQLSCMKCKEVIGKTLCSLGFGDEKDLFIPDKAVEGLVTLSASKAKQRQNRKKADIVAISTEGKTRKRPYIKKSQTVLKSQQSPKKPVKVSPKKEPPTKPNKTGFNIIECAQNMGGLSYSNEDVKTRKSLKRKVVPRKRILVKTKIRRNLQRKTKQPNAFVDDPFVDVSIITDEKFVIECPCMKPNCSGLHPENFLI